ncbi:hypothetical protein NLJ89_g8428 [Agrocybe chaxingu]|uniref:HNH nuclease domain-containing protein n=1 Tax=Agrocybe chaxingu TaxID=84603 RepID=A0A9W8JUP7_9AGAR|nr:hypothetical protein NLJ89_g8428 [Agrocybe chaxingu]
MPVSSEAPTRYCLQCDCPACQQQTDAEGFCDQCDHCGREDGGAYTSTPSKARPKADNQIPKARSVTASASSSQKGRADTEALAANPSLNLPPGIDTACAITLRFGPAAGTETCHILNFLEFLWGMGHKEFDVDTSTNLLWLSSGLHHTFDEGYWALLPMDFEILSSMQLFYESWRTCTEMTEDSYKRFQKVESILHNNIRLTHSVKASHYGNRKGFLYAFLPLSRPKRFSMPIVRLKSPLLDPPSAADLFFFPYANFPILTLHIEPHYVIWNLGQKFKARGLLPTYISNDPDLVGPLAKYNSPLKLSLEIFAMWDKLQTPTWFINKGPDVMPPPNAADGPSEHGTRSKKRRRTGGGGGADGGDDGGGGGGGGDGTSGPSGCNAQENVDGELNEEVVGPDDSSSQQHVSDSTDESSDELKDDFMETQEAFSNRIHGWCGDVMIYNGKDDQASLGSVMALDLPGDANLTPSKLGVLENTRPCQS